MPPGSGRGGWRRFVAAFGSPRDVFSRPLAVGLTTLGLAGLLLASAPSILPASDPATVLSTVGKRGRARGARCRARFRRGPGPGPRAVVGRRVPAQRPRRRQPRQQRPRRPPPQADGLARSPGDHRQVRAPHPQRRTVRGRRAYVGCRGAGAGPGHGLAGLRREPGVGRPARRADRWSSCPVRS